MFTKAQAGQLWFSKPLRLVELEPVVLFENNLYQVVPTGVGYAIRTKRDGRVDDRIFASPKAAESEVLRRQPTKVA